MHRELFLLALLIAAAAQAQPAPDANPREEQNRQGANAAAGATDPATKARIRVEGAAGGTGARVPEEAKGDATVGDGGQHRRSPPKPPDPQESDTYNEKSSGHEQARGARGAIR